MRFDGAVSGDEKGFSTHDFETDGSVEHPRITTCVLCFLYPVCKTCPAGTELEAGRCDGVPEYLCRDTKELVRLLREVVKEEQRAESSG